MSDLIVIGYADEATAQHVWEDLVKLQHDYLVDLGDAAIIRRDGGRPGRAHLGAVGLGRSQDLRGRIAALDRAAARRVAETDS